jgi:uncharacterized protein (DUF488 family)
MELLTVGYEGLTISCFLEKLNIYGVETLVDVREKPISRKAGFSKSALCLALNEIGIEYIHLKGLGCPTPIRHGLRNSGNWEQYKVRYLAYLSSQDESMSMLNVLAGQSRCTLLCFEANPNECHRSLVANRLITHWNSKLRIIHISGDQPIHRKKLSSHSTMISAVEFPMHLLGDISVR